MSFNRENVVWQSGDGTWSRGFFTCYQLDYSRDGGDDPDPEWDVEYEHDSFQWASCGHPTEDAAVRSWNGANPRDCWTHEHSGGDDRLALCYDVMAAELEDQGARRYGRYSGLSRLNDPAILAARLDAADARLRSVDRDQLSFRLRGYANDMSGKAADALKQRALLWDRMNRLGLITPEGEQQRHETDIRERLKNLRELHDELDRQRSGLYEALDKSLDEYERKVAVMDRREERDVRTAGRQAAASGVQGRVPPGTPSGGRFAAKSRAEAEIDL